MPGLLDLKSSTIEYRHQAVRLALAMARQAEHCRLMEKTWRKLAQRDRAEHYEAQAADFERRVLELDELAKRLP